MCSRECGKHFNGCVKVSIFFQQSHCATSMGVSVWLKRGGSSHFFALSCQHSQFLMVKVTAEWYSKRMQECFGNNYIQLEPKTGIDSQKAQQGVWFIWNVVQKLLKPLRIFAVRERVGNKVICWQVSVENVKMPLWVEKKTSCKELEMLFSLYLTFLSVALIKVRTSQADVFIEIDHGVERMGLLVVDY